LIHEKIEQFIKLFDENKEIFSQISSYYININKKLSDLSNNIINHLNNSYQNNKIGEGCSSPQTKNAVSNNQNNVNLLEFDKNNIEDEFSGLEIKKGGGSDLLNLNLNSQTEVKKEEFKFLKNNNYNTTNNQNIDVLKAFEQQPSVNTNQKQSSFKFIKNSNVKANKDSNLTTLLKISIIIILITKVKKSKV